MLLKSYNSKKFAFFEGLLSECLLTADGPQVYRRHRKGTKLGRKLAAVKLM
jgi:hypothetical protein